MTQRLYINGFGLELTQGIRVRLARVIAVRIPQEDAYKAIHVVERRLAYSFTLSIAASRGEIEFYELLYYRVAVLSVFTT